MVGTIVSQLCLDHLLTEVSVRCEDQGTESVDPEILMNENPLVQQMESWNVESHRVRLMVPETVDKV